MIIASTSVRIARGLNKYARNPKCASNSWSVLHNNKAVLLLRLSSSMSTKERSISAVPGRPTWQQFMLRIVDANKSLRFYTDIMGMTLIDRFDFPQWEFSLYFLTTLPDGTTYDLKPGTQAAHDYLWTYEGVTLELTHNHDTAGGDVKRYHTGNQKNDGFGHIAFSCDDVCDATSRLIQAGVPVKEEVEEGRTRGLTFAYDPDGYCVEVVKRMGKPGDISNYFNLSQTILRIKDPRKSISFYENLGMKVVNERHYYYHHGNFSLYFLSSKPITSLFNPILNLTHIHGTENDTSFQYYNGNEQDRQGFGHIGFLVDDVYKACDAIRTMGYGLRKEPDGGNMKGLAFAFDPDGYSVEIIKRGGIDFFDAKKD